MKTSRFLTEFDSQISDQSGVIYDCGERSYNSPEAVRAITCHESRFLGSL